MTKDDETLKRLSLKQANDFLFSLAGQMVELKQKETEAKRALESLQSSIRLLDAKGRIAAQAVENLEKELSL